MPSTQGHTTEQEQLAKIKQLQDEIAAEHNELEAVPAARTHAKRPSNDYEAMQQEFALRKSTAESVMAKLSVLAEELKKLHDVKLEEMDANRQLPD